MALDRLPASQGRLLSAFFAFLRGKLGGSCRATLEATLAPQGYSMGVLSLIHDTYYA